MVLYSIVDHYAFSAEKSNYLSILKTNMAVHCFYFRKCVQDCSFPILSLVCYSAGEMSDFMQDKKRIIWQLVTNKRRDREQVWGYLNTKLLQGYPEWISKNIVFWINVNFNLILASCVQSFTEIGIFWNMLINNRDG